EGEGDESRREKGKEIQKTTPAEIEAAIDRVKQSNIEQRDVELIERLLRTVLVLVKLLERKNISIKKLVSLRQSGVGTGFVRADATLPKGHLRAGLDFIGLDCGGGAFRRRRSSLRSARRQECWYASSSSGATPDKLIARLLGNSESR